MHEMTLANGILTQTLSAVASHGEVRIEEVLVEIGVLRQVVPEALELAWQAVSEQTLAQGALLSIVDIEPSAHCRPCGRVFVPAIDDFLCPGCGQADVDIVAGNDIILKTVTCEDVQGDQS